MTAIDDIQAMFDLIILLVWRSAINEISVIQTRIDKFCWV